MTRMALPVIVETAGVERYRGLAMNERVLDLVIDRMDRNGEITSRLMNNPELRKVAFREMAQTTKPAPVKREEGVPMKEEQLHPSLQETTFAEAPFFALFTGWEPIGSPVNVWLDETNAKQQAETYAKTHPEMQPLILWQMTVAEPARDSAGVFVLVDRPGVIESHSSRFTDADRALGGHPRATIWRARIIERWPPLAEQIARDSGVVE